jgi:hypothetical protein
MKSKKTLGENTTIHSVKYRRSETDAMGFDGFELSIDVSRLFYLILIEESELENKDPSFSVSGRVHSNELCRQHLIEFWPELVSICKHERTEQKRAEEY